jgi:hypothetical protein
MRAPFSSPEPTPHDAPAGAYSSPAPCPTPTAPAPRAHARAGADGHLGALPALARPRVLLRLRRRRPRHGHHAQRREARASRRRSRSTRIQRGAPARLARTSPSASTTSAAPTPSETRRWSERIYQRLRPTTHIAEREITQAYDPEKGLFLADRFIKGTCPRCRTPDQYGDNCEACGATYTPADLIDPVSALSGATPVERSPAPVLPPAAVRRHAPRVDRLGNAAGGRRQQAARVDRQRLQEWDISRDAPYFGFPSRRDGQVFLCVAGCADRLHGQLRELCAREGVDFDATSGSPGGDTELYHFIGKDIINFHGLFWPAMLHSAGCARRAASSCTVSSP